MDNFTSIIEDLIRSQVGKTAKYRVYDRQVRNPMNVVLDEAVRQLPKKFSVYWIEGGIPENFSLLGLEPTPLAFNIRFVEIASVLQKIITLPVSKNIRSQLSERLCLRLISELSLSYGDPEFAALSFVKSILGQSFHLPTTNLLYELELAPLDEAYMVTWFFGLVHEIGHIFSKNRIDSFLDEHLQNVFENGLDNFYYSGFPEELKHEARKRAKQSSSILSIDNLRTEAVSDIFAISVLLVATIQICHMPQNGQTFRYDQFISQVIVFINILVIFQRCRDMAKIASHPVSDLNANLEMLFAPLSSYVRSSVATTYLERAFLWGADRSSQKELDQIIDMNRKLIIANMDHFKDVINDVEGGLARAMRFALFPNEREHDLMSKFLQETSKSDSGTVVVKMETKAFCEQAESLGMVSENIQALRRAVGLKEIELVYTVPWVKGPGQIDRPFGLNTKYGHLVFVFQRQGELYKVFFNSSTQALADGHVLQTAAVKVRSREQLIQELAKRMPSGPFSIVFEGTSEFRQIMQELAQDTIWSTKMLTVTVSTTGIDVYEGQEWADELAKVYADMIVENVNVSENKISFKAGFSGMDDIEPSDIATRIEEYLTTNEAFQLTNISVSDGHQKYEFRQYRYNAVDWYDKGNALAGVGKYQEAIECYDKGLEINPNYAFAWTNKGNALYYLGKYQEAIQCFDKAIELDPNLAEPWNNKGLALDELGKRNEAIECYDKAIKIDPSLAKD